jgi:hypothetical protein
MTVTTIILVGTITPTTRTMVARMAIDRNKHKTTTIANGAGMTSIQCITEVAEATEIILLTTTILHMIATDLLQQITAMIHAAIILLDTTIDTRDGGAQV